MDRIVLPDADTLAIAAADLVESEIAAHHALMLGLAGGSTPRLAHRHLSTAAIDWSGVTAWVPDERWVPPDHEHANQRMMRETLTEAVGLEFLAPRTSAGNPAEAARQYGDLIVPMLTDTERRSVIMLGLGPDGHTASLFPGTTALTVKGPSYVANFVPRLDTWRLTATFDLIATADVVIFLVSGGDKSEVVAEIARGVDHPAGRITARERVLWVLDEAAAEGL